ncbi:glycosyltransferase family 4 protein [Acinetobacter indicus]|uniref:Glycosyl transferase family 1 domain-containing protein n=1 Tax=Acinetobacter indicus CIP 110367 TaxID=1341679 RepID=V2VHK4_9GAMM|nr:glycosyltransferase family 4 protein [Acinetobacter indicus]EPF73104.1 hypothetical protein F956_01213 [Acinetobacter indicus ANC 4215]ESK46999.1 hypothetical protein P253_02718 [Acinetobacter indicus CIP 110367]
MKKICFLIGNLNNSGGTERVTTLIANALAQKNFQVSILSLADGKQSFFELVPSIKTYSLYPEKISFKKNFFGAVWRIRKFVTQYQIDTLVVVDSISCVFTIPALFGLRVKHICWEHFNFKVNLGVKYRDIGRKWAAKYCDYIVTLTHRDQELWKNNLSNIRSKIITIVNPSTFEGIEHIPDLDCKVVLAVGRYRHQKGYDLLLQAWSSVTNKEGWKLVIVGEGEDKQKIIDLSEFLKINDTVEINSSTHNIAQYFKSASFYCMSSRFEGLPMVLLEAQSFGLPIVSFDCDTGPAELIDNEVSGYLVEPENIEKLSEAITKMINLDKDSYLRMCINAKENVNNFKVDEIVKKWLAIL